MPTILLLQSDLRIRTYNVRVIFPIYHRRRERERERIPRYFPSRISCRNSFKRKSFIAILRLRGIIKPGKNWQSRTVSFGRDDDRTTSWNGRGGRARRFDGFVVERGMKFLFFFSHPSRSKNPWTSSIRGSPPRRIRERDLVKIGDRTFPALDR